jgi:uncharacterized DUF497 family protein
VGRRIKFDFDTANLDHIAVHDVSRREIVQAFRGENLIIQASDVKRDPRWKLFGKTMKNRYLTVVFTLRKGRVRPITAYTMNRKDRDLYAPQID